MRTIKNVLTTMTRSLHSERFAQLLLIGCLALGMLVQTGCDDDGNLVEVPDLPTPETPGTPSGLTAESGTGEIGLSWEEVEPVDSYVVSYSVYRSTSPIGDLPDEPVETGVSGLSFTDGEVDNGTTYYYRVTATTRSGEAESEGSNEAAATPFASPPERP